MISGKKVKAPPTLVRSYPRLDAIMESEASNLLF
jgi:hypothetical protein